MHLDLRYAASLLARFMHCPTNEHFGTVKRVLRNVQGTLNYGLEYEKGKEMSYLDIMSG